MLWRWYEIVFAWVLFLSVTMFIIRIKEDTDIDELNDQLINALWEHENLQIENDELNVRLAALDEKIRIQDMKRIKKNYDDSTVVRRRPSADYETLRRRAYSNIRELWRYVDSSLRSLEKRLSRATTTTGKSADDATAHVRGVRRGVGDRGASLLKDLSDLAAADGYAEWRRRESYDLSGLVQNRLDDLQNPAYGDAARHLVCDFNETCGFGCHLHHAVYCFITAYETQRTWTTLDRRWRDVWSNVFLPLTENASTVRINSMETWPGGQGSRSVKLPTLENTRPRPALVPQTLPDDLAPRISVLHGDPIVWWIGQFVKFLLRPKAATSNKLDERARKIDFRKPIVGVHVRRTDKVDGRGAKYHELDEYMGHVEEYYKIKELSGNVDKKRVYLATDEPRLFSEARRKYPDYDIIGDEDVSATSSVNGNRTAPRSLDGIVADVHFLSHSDHIVCTFSSHVCRLAYEMMNSLHADASTRYASLDDIYFYGGQNHRLGEAVLPHRARGPHEIDLHVGDEIFVASNRWNGYSEGINLRTGKEGLYPTFKVTSKVETAVLNVIYPETEQ